jgi:hypothetical protein
MIKIRKGNENHAPVVCYVYAKKNQFGLYVCDALNTGETFFSKDNDLIEFDTRKDNYTKLLDELKKLKQL